MPFSIVLTFWLIILWELAFARLFIPLRSLASDFVDCFYSFSFYFSFSELLVKLFVLEAAKASFPQFPEPFAIITLWATPPSQYLWSFVYAVSIFNGFWVGSHFWTPFRILHNKTSSSAKSPHAVFVRVFCEYCWFVRFVFCSTPQFIETFPPPVFDELSSFLLFLFFSVSTSKSFPWLFVLTLIWASSDIPWI